jgi:predicted ferric reductase
MSTETRSPAVRKPSPWRLLTSFLATAVIIGMILAVSILAVTAPGRAATQGLRWLFGLDSIQLWWYVTRASGIVAYLLLWLSMVLGLAVTSKYADAVLDRMFTYDFHQFISLLAIVFLVVHVSALLVDRYLPYSIWQVLIPFASPYRPFWVGVGVLSFYTTMLVTVTFYMRKRIGMRTFRVIHYLSLAGYLGATLHGLFAGTDSPLPTMRLLYAGTGLAVVFLTVYWLTLVLLRKLDGQAAGSPLGSHSRMPR